jgi:hypothetical protein
MMVYYRITLKRMAAEHPLVSTRFELEIHPIMRARKSLIMHRVFRMKVRVFWYTVVLRLGRKTVGGRKKRGT